MTKTKTKPILEWFEGARAAGHEWADAAIENAHQYKSAYTEADSLCYALCIGFIWSETKQGRNFWSNVHDSLPKNS